MIGSSAIIMDGEKLIEISTEHIKQLKDILETFSEIVEKANIDIIKDPNDVDDDSDSESDSESDNESDSDSDSRSDSGSDTDSSDESVDKKKKAPKPVSKSVMKMEAVDTSQTVYICMRLYAKYFRKFRCAKKKVTMGVMLSTLCESIKSNINDDYLTMYMDRNDDNFLHVIVNNDDAGTSMTEKIGLLDMDNKVITMPTVDFEVKITISAQEFHKVCKSMAKVGDYVEIVCSEKKFTLKCKGAMSERTNIFAEVDDEKNNISIVFDPSVKNSKVIRQCFELKNITYLNKFQNLCQHMEIYMEQDKPMGIIYSVSNVGKIIVFISHIVEPNDYQDYDDGVYQDYEPEYI